MKTLRIATVTASDHPQRGQRFVVQQWRDEYVHCWGQVTRFDGRRRRHGESVRFHQDSVEITDVESTARLSAELFDQSVDDLYRRGARLIARGRDYDIVRPPFDESFVALAAELEINLRAITEDEIATVRELLGQTKSGR